MACQNMVINQLDNLGPHSESGVSLNEDGK